MPKARIAPIARGVSRRRVLTLGASSGALLLSGCGAEFGGLRPSGDERRTALPGRAALIAPVSGRAAELGQIIRNSATLGGNALSETGEVQLFDSGDTPEAAADAARRAAASGARLIVGPLFGAQAAAAEAAAGNVPVMTLSNDASVAGARVFVIGVTAEQSAQSILSFAQRRGLTRIGIVVPPGAFGARAGAAALAAGRALGLDMLGPVTTTSVSEAQASLGPLPDAIYLPSAGASLEDFAAAFRGRTQILGSDQWSAIDPSRVPVLDGALYPAPDPVAFEPFARAYEDAYGDVPGILAGIAFDAIESARLLGRVGQQDRRGLLRESGFNGVIGPFRFNRDGTCRRGLAVLRVGRGNVSLIGAASA
ncbi:MAG: penicillin-binding protein activator [Pseudomonadota bacterium]